MKRLDYFLCTLKIDKNGSHFYSPFLTTKSIGDEGTRVEYSSEKMRKDIPDGVFMYPSDDYENCPKSAYCQLTGDIVKGQPMYVTEDQFANDKLWVVPSKKASKATVAPE